MPYSHDEDGLTQKRRAFIDEYLLDFNATQAAKRAGYSERSAHAIGSRLLHVPAVKAALDKAIAARAERTHVTAARVIEQYRRIGFSDIRHFVMWDKNGVTLRPHTSLRDEDASAIAEVRPIGDTGQVHIRLHEKRPALDALARHVGLFNARIPGRPGFVPLPFAGDHSNAQQREARAALKKRIEALLADKDAAAKKENETTETATNEPSPPCEEKS